MLSAEIDRAVDASIGTDKAVSRKILENGLAIFAAPASGKGVVSISVSIKAGLIYEDNYAGSGISHIVEHMLFKGTSTREAGMVEQEVRQLGGYINGGVSQDMTDITLTIPSSNLQKGLELLKDLLFNAAFAVPELDKEKQVILKEINLYKDDPEHTLANLLNANAYLDHPYKYPIIGYADKLAALTREDMLKYYVRMYVPNRIAVAMVGDIDPLRALTIAAGVFASSGKSDYSYRHSVVDEPRQIDNRYATAEIDANLAYLAIGFHSTSLTDKDLFALDVLAMILGRGDNSRLNCSLLKDKGIVHSIQCRNFTPRDKGLFTITAVLDRDRIDDAENAIIKEIENIKSGVMQEEVESAKQMVLADYIFSRQSTASAADDITFSYIMTGSPNFPSVYVDGIRSVTTEDVKAVSEKYLLTSAYTAARVVPKGYKQAEQKAPFPSTAFPMRRIELSNGLRVILRENRHLPIFSMVAAIGGGVMDETSRNNGISNLTADMMLKGTARRKESEISGAVEARGGYINTFSGFNCFGINLQMLSGDISYALDLVRDILTNATFPQEQLDKERSIILAAIKEEDSDIFSMSLNTLRSALFEGSPYALRYLGNAESVNRISQAEVSDFYASHIAAGNIVIGLSGDFDSDEIIGRIRGMYADIKKGPSNLRKVELPPLGQTKKLTVKADKEEALILLGFRTTGTLSADRFCLDIIQSVMSGFSGRLFKSARQDTPLSYTLGCIQKMAFDAGYFVFYVATTEDHVHEARAILLSEIEKLRRDGVTAGELSLSKGLITTQYYIRMQTNEFFAQNSSFDELYGIGYDDLYRYIERVEAVSVDDVSRIVNKYFDLKSCVELVIMPE